MTMAESSPGTSFDSSRERLGAVYAKGLLGAAEGQHVTDRVLAELDSLIDDVLEPPREIRAVPGFSTDPPGGKDADSGLGIRVRR